MGELMDSDKLHVLSFMRKALDIYPEVLIATNNDLPDDTLWLSLNQLPPTMYMSPNIYFWYRDNVKLLNLLNDKE